MRFALNQIQVQHPPSTRIKDRASPIISTDGKELGVYLSLQRDNEETSEPTKRVIFWIFGGAFLAGDVEGNIGVAEEIGMRCNADVFLAHIRLLPENEFEDACDDVYHAYKWLVETRGLSPENVILYGISSGGGLAVNLMQRLIKEGNEHLGPAGAVLMCPFVDYTEPQGSMLHYINHDLIVNQSVYETGIPYLAIKLGSDENRRKASPVYGRLAGLPPMCVVVSEHECCYDQCILLANRAREASVDCTLGVWKYMCHTFPVLSPFLPEGKQAQDFMCDWMSSRFDVVSSKVH